MKKSRWREFKQRIYVKAPVERVYRLWATSAGLTKWWPIKARYTTPEGRNVGSNDLAEEGGRYWMAWPGGVEESGTVLEANNRDLIKFTFGKDIRVTVKLIKRKKGTLVDLVQRSAWPSEEENMEVYLEYYPGWVFYLTNLKSVLEARADLREKEPDVEHLINL